MARKFLFDKCFECIEIFLKVTLGAGNFQCDDEFLKTWYALNDVTCFWYFMFFYPFVVCCETTYF